jgi:hypothetical protein
MGGWQLGDLPCRVGKMRFPGYAQCHCNLAHCIAMRGGRNKIPFATI